MPVHRGPAAKRSRDVQQALQRDRGAAQSIVSSSRRHFCQLSRNCIASRRNPGPTPYVQIAAFPRSIHALSSSTSLAKAPPPRWQNTGIQAEQHFICDCSSCGAPIKGRVASQGWHQKHGEVPFSSRRAFGRPGPACSQAGQRRRRHQARQRPAAAAGSGRPAVAAWWRRQGGSRSGACSGGALPAGRGHRAIASHEQRGLHTGAVGGAGAGAHGRGGGAAQAAARPLGEGGRGQAAVGAAAPPGGHQHRRRVPGEGGELGDGSRAGASWKGPNWRHQEKSGSRV